MSSSILQYPREQQPHYIMRFLCSYSNKLKKKSSHRSLVPSTHAGLSKSLCFVAVVYKEVKDIGPLIFNIDAQDFPHTEIDRVIPLTLLYSSILCAPCQLNLEACLESSCYRHHMGIVDLTVLWEAWALLSGELYMAVFFCMERATGSTAQLH